MNRTVGFALVSILVVGFFVVRAGADAASDFEALFGAEARKVAATRIKSDDVALAAKLLAAAAGAPDSPKFQILLYEKACEFGRKSKDGYAHAIAAVRRLAAADPKRQDECDQKLLSVHDLQYRTARGKERIKAGGALSGYLQSFAEARIAAGKTAEALTAYRRALVVAKSIRSKDAKTITGKINATVALQHTDRKAASLRKALKDKPDDKRTAKQLLMLLLVEKNDPKAAGELLESAEADETTRTFIPLATKTWDELPEDTYIDLGAWYQQLARRTSGGARLKMLARARAYYETYLTLRGKQDATGLRATMPLKELNQELAPAGRIDCGYLPPPKCVTKALAQWTKKRDALPVKQRLPALRKKLSEVNSGAEIEIKGYKIDGDRIVNLRLDNNPALVSIAPLYGMKLRTLSIWATRVEYLEPLAGMKLTELRIVGCPGLLSLKGIGDMPITKLDLFGSKRIESLELLRGMPLTYLGLRAVPMKTLKGLEGMPLETLNLYDCQKLEDIKALSGAPLRKLNVANCWKLKNFQPLRGLPLTSLTANRLTQREMTLLKGMPLTRLSIDGCKITSLDALAGMRLTRLSVGGCRTLDNLRGIEKMPLEYLNLSGTRFATKQVAENLKKKIPTLKEVKIK